jgi:hypothetical protein
MLFHDARNAALGQASMRADDPDVIALAERWTSLRETGLRLPSGCARAGRRGRGLGALVAPGFAARAKVERGGARA